MLSSSWLDGLTIAVRLVSVFKFRSDFWHTDVDRRVRLSSLSSSSSAAATAASSALQLALVLLAEAVAGGEEVPAALLVHVPDVGLLSGVLRLVLVDEVHQEEPVEGEEWILEIETCLEVEIVQRQDAGSRNLSSVFYLMSVRVELLLDQADKVPLDPRSIMPNKI